jgi:polar amino acid transport system permease protein
MTTVETRPASAATAPPPGTPYDQMRVVPARHPGRWVATAVVAVLLAMVVNSLVTNPRWEWDVVAYLTEESIVRGVLTTIELTAITAVLGFALGTVLALMRLSRSPLLQAVSWGCTWVFARCR